MSRHPIPHRAHRSASLFTLRRSALAALALCSAALCLPLQAAPTSGLELAGMDRSARPQDDLFRAANGHWLDHSEIPAERSVIMGAELEAKIDERVQAIVRELTAKPQRAGSIEQKIASYYRSYVDTAAIERAGLKPMQPLLRAIDAIDSPAALARYQGLALGRLQTPVWLWGGFADFQDNTLNRAIAMQGGLGLPDREYYLHPEDARFGAARQAYLDYLTTLGKLAGLGNPAEAAARVLALETRIAEAHTPQEAAMNPGAFRALDAAGLQALAPGFDWAGFFAAAGLKAGEKVNVAQPTTVTALAKLFAEQPLADWQLYFKLRSLDEAAPVLPQAFRDAHFQLRGRTLSGQPAQAPREQSATIALSGAMSEALARVYVERHFPASHKARVQTIVDQLTAEAREAVAHMAWMSAPAKAEADAKLAGMRAKIGYPDRWRDYGALEQRDGDALGNRHRAKRFEWERQAAMSGTKVDRGLWMMTPLTDNAFYDPQLNEINLPAGVLQAPRFDIAADDAVNYGQIGALIGHEISHSFDPMGAQFDAQGRVRDWWSAADHQAFKALSERLVKQFDRYEIVPGKPVNGRQTLAENMADVLGLDLAVRAYRRSLAGKPAAVIDGYSGEQRLFMSYAQRWRFKAREAQRLAMSSGDPHALPEFRTNGAALNVDAFHEAFGTKDGDALWKPQAERFHLW